MALVTALLALPANDVSPSGTLTNTTGVIRLSVALASGTGPGTWQLCKQNADSTAWFLVPGAILSVGSDQPNAISVGQLNWEDKEGSALYHVVQTRPSGQAAVMTGASVYLSAETVIAQSVGAVTTSTITASGAIIGQSTLAITGATTLTGAATLSSTLAVTGASTFGSSAIITSASANSLAVGLNGSTNPTLKVDSSTASSATGLQVKSAAAAAGVALSVISSGTNESLTINAKGTGTITAQSAVAVPAGGSAGASLLLSSTAALGIYVGSGVPTVSAAQGSFYLRTDGSTSSTRLYVNSSGSTTWVAVTTAS